MKTANNILKVAQNPSQKFALVKDNFDGIGGKEVYAIKYSVGTPREDYLTSGSENLGTEQIKTWKTTAGVTKAWLKLLAEHGASEIAQ